jgi:flavin reductase (DIM6/NTAB) family NADH-FMN oxidoreductase RutF
MDASPPPSSVSSAEFTEAMSRHVAAVCVVATICDGERYGLTATAVSSVSASPPRLLVCISKSSFTHDKIIASGCFAINVLAGDQDPIAKLFAGLAGDKTDAFSLGAWTALNTGAPVLVGAAATFDCLLAETVDQPTHTLFIGDVVGVATRPGQDPLLYGAREFRQLRKVMSALDADEALDS